MSKKNVTTGGEIVQQADGQAEFLLYQTEDAQTRVQLRLQGGMVWMPQRQLAELYQVSVPTINGHLRVLYQNGELVADRTIRKFRIVAREAAREVERLVDHYSLEVILHLGYRVRSHRGVQFRRWATNVSRAGRTAAISRNCWRASATFALPRKCSGARCSTFTPPASTTT